MNRFRSLTIANIKMTFRARQALFWNLAFPIIMLVLLALVLGNGGGFGVTVGVVGDSHNPITAAARQALGDIKDVTLKTGSEAEERAALKNGDRDAVLVIPGQLPTSRQPVPVTMYYDQTNLTQSSAVVALVSQVVQGIDEHMLQQRTGIGPQVVLNQQGISAVSTRYIDFLAPGIIAFALMTSGVIGVSSRMVGYREKRILKRLRATPMQTWEFVLSNVISQLFVVLAQVAILVGVATLLFNVHVVGSMGTLIALAMLGGLAFLTIGFAVSGLASTVESASAIGNVITLPMMFLSGIYFPVSGAPGWLQPIINVLPLTYLANGLRDVMEKGLPISSIGVDFVVLAITSAVALAVSTRTFRWDVE